MPPSKQGGFGYIGLLVTVAIIGMAAAATVKVGALVQRRQAEQALLDIGDEFRNALISYATVTPVGQLPAPQSLEALLKDPRYPNVVRHLRKVYADPITGKAEWGLVIAPGNGGIIGIHSLSTAVPIKINHFDPKFQYLVGKVSYADWIFMSTSANLPPPVASAASSPTSSAGSAAPSANASSPTPATGAASSPSLFAPTGAGAASSLFAPSR